MTQQSRQCHQAWEVQSLEPIGERRELIPTSYYLLTQFIGVYTCTQINSHTHTHKHKHSHIHIQAHIATHTNGCKHTCVWSHMHTHRHAHIGIYPFRCTQAHTCSSTNTQTHSHKWTPTHMTTKYIVICLFYVYKYTANVFRHTSKGHQMPLHLVLSQYVVAENWTQDLWKSSQCYKTLHLSSPKQKSI